MSYLVCDRCGGYYELMEGESPRDYECQCGGKLRVVESIYGDSKKENPRIKKFISNKPAVIASIIFIILVLVAMGIYFTPIPEKLESSLPNEVGAYYVPDSMKKASSITGIPYDSRFNDPVKYNDLESVQSVEKTYIRNDGPFEIKVSIIYLDDTSPDELEGIYHSMLYNNQQMVIAGKNVDCVEYLTFSWYGNQYIVRVDVYGADLVSESQCHAEGLNFLNSFIPEFEKTNRFM